MKSLHWSVLQIVDPLLHGFNSVVSGEDGTCCALRALSLVVRRNLMRWADLSALSMAASAIFFAKRSSTLGESSNPWASRAA